MAYNIRTIETLSTQARQFFTQAIPGAIASVWANTFTVLGKVMALLDFEHELRRAQLYNQLFASTAGPLWLARHGYELGLTQDPGNYATGNVTMPCIAGTYVPGGLTFTRADGTQYTSLAAIALTSGSTVSIPVIASAAASAGNCPAGTTLALAATLATTVAGLGTTATVDSNALTGGADAQTTEEFRAEVLFRKRNPPQGGSASDYELWAQEALSTVANVYVDSFTNDTRSVWLCFTVTDQTNGIPSSGEVATVQTYVSDPIRRPITARVFVTAPAPVPQNIRILNLSPGTAAVQAAITAELTAFFADQVSPATPSTPFVLFQEGISDAITRAAGVVSFDLATPAGDVTFTTPGNLPTLGTIAWV